MTPDKQHSNRLSQLAFVLDEFIRIPGTSIRIGLDPVLGLIPGVGDTLSSLFSYLIVYQAARLGASPWVIVRMTGNVLLDTILGAVPFLGDLFDIAFKANSQNIQILRTLESQPGARVRSSVEVKNMLVLIFIFAILTIALGLVLTGFVLGKIFEAIA